MIPCSLYSIFNKYLMQYIAQRIIVLKNCNVVSETSICIGYRVRGKDRYQESMMSNRRCECRELSLSLSVSGSRIRFIWQNDTQETSGACARKTRDKADRQERGQSGARALALASWTPRPGGARVPQASHLALQSTMIFISIFMNSTAQRHGVKVMYSMYLKTQSKPIMSRPLATSDCVDRMFPSVLFM